MPPPMIFSDACGAPTPVAGCGGGRRPPDALVCVPGVSEALGAVCGVGVRRVRGPRFGELGAHAWVSWLLATGISRCGASCVVSCM